jgi:predicted metal-dependent phosphoesterase TrpH
MRAALHMHSTWSDGEFTLPVLRDIFAGAGCRIIAVTDHAESFDRERLAGYVAECADLSDDRLLIVPGLEFSCRERMHVLGYGVTVRCDSDEPTEVIRHIADHGGVSVIAHPRDDFFPWIRTFTRLPDGIEAWNTKYDGRHAPRPQTFRLIRELRDRKPDLLAFYGIDLHWRHQPRDLHIHLMPPHDDETGGTSASLPTGSAGPIVAAGTAGAPLTRATLLDLLRAGRFEGVMADYRLPSSAAVPDDLLDTFGQLHSRSRRFRNAVMRAKRLADSFGLRPPEALKARLRRWF